jgi:hypothetical protein
MNENLSKDYIGEVRCADGKVRTLFEDDDGRLYILDDNGEKVYGVRRVLPVKEKADQPVIKNPSDPPKLVPTEFSLFDRLC